MCLRVLPGVFVFLRVLYGDMSPPIWMTPKICRYGMGKRHSRLVHVNCINPSTSMLKLLNPRREVKDQWLSGSRRSSFGIHHRYRVVVWELRWSQCDIRELVLSSSSRVCHVIHRHLIDHLGHTGVDLTEWFEGVQKRNTTYDQLKHRHSPPAWNPYFPFEWICIIPYTSDYQITTYTGNLRSRTLVV